MSGGPGQSPVFAFAGQAADTGFRLPWVSSSTLHSTHHSANIERCSSCLVAVLKLVLSAVCRLPRCLCGIKPCCCPTGSVWGLQVVQQTNNFSGRIHQQLHSRRQDSGFISQIRIIFLALVDFLWDASYSMTRDTVSATPYPEAKDAQGDSERQYNTGLVSNL